MAIQTWHQIYYNQTSTILGPLQTQYSSLIPPRTSAKLFRSKRHFPRRCANSNRIWKQWTSNPQWGELTARTGIGCASLALCQIESPGIWEHLLGEASKKTDRMLFSCNERLVHCIAIYQLFSLDLCTVSSLIICFLH